MLSIRDKLRGLSDFYDLTYYYRLMGKMLYQGHVTKIMGAPGIFRKWSNFHDWNPTPMSSQTRKSANMPKLISEFMVKNIYAEYPEFTIGTSTEKIMEVLDRSQFAERDKKQLETQINLGGRFTTFYIEDKKLYLKYITADRGFITNEKNGIPHEAVFYTEFKQEEKEGHQTKTWWYTLLEWHYEENGLRYVKNELYRSSKKSLFEHNYTNRIAEVFGEMVDSEEQVYNIDVPTFVYGTNPINNNVDMRSREGIGAFINCIDALMVVDEAFDTISNELIGGRMFKTIPEGITDQVQDAQSGRLYSSYDNYAPDVISYEDEGTGDKKIDAFAPTLRIESQVQGFNVGIDMVSTSIGVSSGTFRHDGKTIVTATQVLTDKDDTAKTIKTYETSIERYYQDVFLLIKLISNTETMLPNIGEFERKDISVMWKDSVITDDEAKREEDRTVVNNYWMPPTWYLEKYGYAEDEKEAIKLYDLAQEMKRKSEEIIFPDDDLIDNNNPDGDIVGVENGKESVEEILLNGAQITSAVQIVEGYNKGELSRDGALQMLMTFLNIDQDKASIMLDESNKERLEAERIESQKTIKQEEVVKTEPKVEEE